MRARRVIAFLAVTAAVWVVLFFGWGAVLFAIGGIEAVKECQYAEVESTSLGEFTYDDSWPLVPVLLAVPAGAVGWLVTRR